MPTQPPSSTPTKHSRRYSRPALITPFFVLGWVAHIAGAEGAGDYAVGLLVLVSFLAGLIWYEFGLACTLLLAIGYTVASVKRVFFPPSWANFISVVADTATLLFLCLGGAVVGILLRTLASHFRELYRATRRLNASDSEGEPNQNKLPLEQSKTVEEADASSGRPLWPQN